ncbi:hypothetical protein [Flaviflagellibacter deserti]|uniref:CopG family transcriptional regulator n=1 Tax=Flaviflagellibacter deserti TaxID=2267266 RepID=A0ABV9Z7T7_9HYPH
MSKTVEVELPDNVLAALEKWIAGEPKPKPTIGSAVTLGVCEWLAAMGRLPAEACAEEEAA